MPVFSDGNRLLLLDSGKEYFPALLAAIEGAQWEIFLESYIFADDPVGNDVVAALTRAAQRGVAVRVLVDGFGARRFPELFGARLLAAGAQYLIYRQELSWFSFRRFRLRRLHRKLVVVDGRMAFAGGINIIDDNNAPPALRPRYDYAVRVEGPVAAEIRQAMRRMWENVSWASFKRRYRLPPDAMPFPGKPGRQRAAFLARDNLRHRHDIVAAYVEALAKAQKSALIANAYFLPGLRFRRALVGAARRGVEITILLQGQSDHRLFLLASRMLYQSLLAEGIRVFRYQKSFLHAKVAVVDGYWATVGSSNIDPFSLLCAQEGNIVIEDCAFAEELAASLERAIVSGAEEIPPARASLPSRLLARFLGWCTYSVIRGVLGLTGFDARNWRDRDPDESLPPKIP
ncbi:MAG: cardiolipin synthase ClsB [Zoogloeaceae bacterium]|jgi:cardiolipin synthase|nr:cardiolipin synthase ClsB [Zoogloeaceae bacterium]